MTGQKGNRMSRRQALASTAVIATTSFAPALAATHEKDPLENTSAAWFDRLIREVREAWKAHTAAETAAHEHYPEIPRILSEPIAWCCWPAQRSWTEAELVDQIENGPYMIFRKGQRLDSPERIDSDLAETILAGARSRLSVLRHYNANMENYREYCRQHVEPLFDKAADKQASLDLEIARLEPNGVEAIVAKAMALKQYMHPEPDETDVESIWTHHLINAVLALAGSERFEGPGMIDPKFKN